MKTAIRLWCGAVLSGALAFAAAPDGFRPLFNGRDLTGWKIPEGDNGHWKGVDGVIDYDALSEAKGDKHLWTQQAFQDFELLVDWRIKRVFGMYPTPIVLPDGSYQRDAFGEVIYVPAMACDSGILLRGTMKAQANIWLWPVGSGEVYGYRTDMKMPAEVRAAVTPKVKADRPVGEWNTFRITVHGDRLTVVLNGFTVIENAHLPGLPPTGPIGLQHHGGLQGVLMNPASSAVQFRNVYIREF
ncbi:MAG: DUF1080 domain-containing protein [Verrucomicrobia bacterium]|nr:DUF1080 domain-containing protein [Verrucomicrobiota bacterium]